MKLFSWIFLTLIVLETFQCLGRPNYQNVVFILGIYLAILVDLRVDSSENSMAVKALRSLVIVAFISCLLDLWYLVFGSMVGRVDRRWRRD
jgi:hypothetical protein